MREWRWRRAGCINGHPGSILGCGETPESPYNYQFFDCQLILANRANGGSTRFGPA